MLGNKLLFRESAVKQITLRVRSGSDRDRLGLDKQGCHVTCSTQDTWYILIPANIHFSINPSFVEQSLKHYEMLKPHIRAMRVSLPLILNRSFNELSFHIMVKHD